MQCYIEYLGMICFCVINSYHEQYHIGVNVHRQGKPVDESMWIFDNMFYFEVVLKNSVIKSKIINRRSSESTYRYVGQMEIKCLFEQTFTTEKTDALMLKLSHEWCQ